MGLRGRGEIKGETSVSCLLFVWPRPVGKSAKWILFSSSLFGREKPSSHERGVPVEDLDQIPLAGTGSLPSACEGVNRMAQPGGIPIAGSGASTAILSVLPNHPAVVLDAEKGEQQMQERRRISGGKWVTQQLLLAVWCIARVLLIK